MRSYPIADIFIHDCNQFVVALKAVHRFGKINLLVTAFDCREFHVKNILKNAHQTILVVCTTMIRIMDSGLKFHIDWR